MGNMYPQTHSEWEDGMDSQTPWIKQHLEVCLSGSFESLKLFQAKRTHKIQNQPFVMYEAFSTRHDMNFPQL